MNTPVLVGIGSNQNREACLQVALDALADWFGELALSPVYESQAVGFDGSPFLNMVAGFNTAMPLAELSRRFKQLEANHGRLRGSARFAAQTLDIDILTYGDQVGVFCGVELPRAEILVNAFVLKPLADVAGSRLHPQRGQSYQDLWQLHRAGPPLHRVNFSWRDRVISNAVGGAETSDQGIG
ncbi:MULTISPECIES: 2-amino-4-hydroxy-6-hydroxymethyldihydropteridine diphosphokinase [unclassified Marinobacter]|uniref:2-amino-4-hydroxy-6- hydroxymethyldihydropteridine diphosphokinase n=1 Tax=unclassified Marinobacter TaxID=83889 RepID=UPI000BF592C1|nr:MULTISPECIES: 2-amino-4-hydroxy-6-hydroxymethyldihydropteridine diphosphokinase [unclassified Marinobacter]PFG10010.1 2-amino-4-hydroxy-6-hydroxymethyldihydropteridine diphosphokinase [Marinobacter sp. LV10MA510-1]PFG51935.1 2-amino-4-hydroxy-6-hydroxymethyldihydropteridine diphosphokinase [Marinobacter sp. LV10R520-4]